MSKILGPLSLSFDPGSVTADHHWLERGQFFIYKLLQRPKHSFFKVLWVQYPTTTIQHPRLKMPWGMAGEWGDLKPSFALTRASQRPQRASQGHPEGVPHKALSRFPLLRRPLLVNYLSCARMCCLATALQDGGHVTWVPWNLSFCYILFHKKRLQTML